MWKEAVVAKQSHCHVIRMEGLMKATKIISQDYWCLDRDSNRAPLE
jgi:hypothetical protein